MPKPPTQEAVVEVVKLVWETLASDMPWFTRAEAAAALQEHFGEQVLEAESEDPTQD